MSTKAKHTPGPWNRGYGNYVYQGEEHIPSGEQRLIATCQPLNGYKEELQEAFANAKLIAAAPDLLEACKAALLAIQGHERRTGHMQMHPAIDNLRAAITKAQGE